MTTRFQLGGRCFMKQKARYLWLGVAAALTLPGLELEASAAALVAHEWGTFTSLQDESGRTIGGINTDDEPVPKFVHRLTDSLLLRPTELPATFFQGAPSCHPDVTMRLETPVLYFHLPEGKPRAKDVSVRVEFRGGWLSEFYPDAEVNAPGLKPNGMVFGPLHSETMSTLAWNHLEVGGDWAGPTTDQHVWATPRAVRASAVRNAAGEAERFLFYRGVAHIDAPIAVSRDEHTATLTLRSRCPAEVASRQGLAVKWLWLVDIRPEGMVAFRTGPAVTLGGETKVLQSISARFALSDYSAANGDKLRGSLRAALVGDGLYDDEAWALLNTWELSYFKSPGMRLFFLVPRAWTDYYLPLDVSEPAQITRVMVGRIELVTPEQRDYLREIANMEPRRIGAEAEELHRNFYGRINTNQGELSKVNAGQESLAAFGVSVPRSYQRYLALGRFRNALVLEEAARHPTAGLAHFISSYRLEGYKPVEISTTQATEKE
jgi:hypothetical protein